MAFPGKFSRHVESSSGIHRNRIRSLPNSITLIHLSPQTVSCSYWPVTQINGGYYFSAEQCALALCGPSVIVSTLQQPPAQRVRVRHLKSRKHRQRSFRASTRLSPSRDSRCAPSVRNAARSYGNRHRHKLDTSNVCGVNVSMQHEPRLLWFGNVIKTWNRATRLHAWLCASWILGNSLCASDFLPEFGPPAHGKNSQTAIFWHDAHRPN